MPLSLEALTTRRQFLILLGLVSALPAGRLLMSAGTPVPAAAQSPAIRNRAPLAPNVRHLNEINRTAKADDQIDIARGEPEVE